MIEMISHGRGQGGEEGHTSIHSLTDSIDHSPSTKVHVDPVAR